MKILQIASEQFSMESSKIINKQGNHRSEVVLVQKTPIYNSDDLNYDWLFVYSDKKPILLLKLLKKLLLSDYDILVLHGCTISIRHFPFFEYKFVRKMRGEIPIVFMLHSQNRVQKLLRKKIYEYFMRDRRLLVTYVSINMPKYLPEASLYTPQPIPNIFRPNSQIDPDDPPVVFLPSGGSWAYRWKGKAILLKSLKAIKRRGVKFQYREHKGRLLYYEMAKYYWKSTLVFDQIYDEVYGKVTPEAFMCGRVALNDSYYPLEENTVDKNNLTSKLEMFLTDEELRRKVAEKGREIVLKRHSAEAATKRFVNILELFVEAKGLS